VWEERFDEPADALRELDALRKQAEKLSAAVGLSLQATLHRLKREGRSDVWVDISEADLCFLLRERLPERVLAESEELPRWLREKPNYSIWQRDNLWMLYNALAAGGDNVTLIALWNGEAGDGSGGTRLGGQGRGPRGQDDRSQDQRFVRGVGLKLRVQFSSVRQVSKQDQLVTGDGRFFDWRHIDKQLKQRYFLERCHAQDL
jgi:hypothetical protein